MTDLRELCSNSQCGKPSVIMAEWDLYGKAYSRGYACDNPEHVEQMIKQMAWSATCTITQGIEFLEREHIRGQQREL